MKRQFWLIGIVLLAALSACRSKSKDGPTDTYSSGVIAIAADESFEPIVQEEIDVFESLYPLAGIVPRYTTEGNVAKRSATIVSCLSMRGEVCRLPYSHGMPEYLKEVNKKSHIANIAK